MLRKKFNHLIEETFNNNKKFIPIIIGIYFLINFNYLFFGGIIYDDWSLSTNHIGYSLIERIKINCLLYFNTRPLGGLYVSLIAGFEKNDFAYILINISLWLISGLVLYLSLSKIFNKKSSIIFLLIFLFPSFASTPFFSPVTQSLGVLSIFFWSISIYYSVQKKIKYVLLFYIMSLLTYEYTVALFLFNILFLSIENNKTLDYKKFFLNLTKLILQFLILIFAIIIFQFIIAKITNNTAPLKYAFTFVENQIVFEDNFFQNIKKYFNKPLIIIFKEIPLLFIDSFNFIKINFYNSLVYISLLVFLVNLFFLKTNTNQNIIIKTFFLFILFSSFFVFCMYLMVSSVPQINGYYNRGLVGLFVCFSFFICWLSEYNFKYYLFEKFKFLAIILIIFLNFNSFYIQKNNFTETEKIRLNILNNVSNFFKNKNEAFVMMIVPTYLEKNFNDETIFSEEVDDLHFAVNYATNKKVHARRVFYSKDCKNIFQIVGKQIYGFVPSRNRKNKNMIRIKLFPFFKNDNLYFYYDNNFFKLSSNNLENFPILSRLTKCTY